MANSSISSLRSNLTEAQRALLEKRMKGKPTAAPQAIAPRKQQQDVPVSFGQQRLWFLQQAEPNSVAYNIPAGLHLEGDINVAALEASLDEIVKRHEVLRTTF